MDDLLHVLSQTLLAWLVLQPKQTNLAVLVVFSPATGSQLFASFVVVVAGQPCMTACNLKDYYMLMLLLVLLLYYYIATDASW